MADIVPILRPVPDATSRSPRPVPTSRREPLWRHALGARLRQLRHERGETLDETAARAGVSPQYLSEMERGVKDPSSEMVAAVAGALEVTLVDLTLGVAESIRPGAAASAPAQAGRQTVLLALAA
ncbi:MAG TPA: helix-turn-helix transcriptional regulator [Cellulomonas sp.]